AAVAFSMRTLAALERITTVLDESSTWTSPGAAEELDETLSPSHPVNSASSSAMTAIIGALATTGGRRSSTEASESSWRKPAQSRVTSQQLGTGPSTGSGRAELFQFEREPLTARAEPLDWARDRLVEARVSHRCVAREWYRNWVSPIPSV